jgi:hypothetical protein
VTVRIHQLSNEFLRVPVRAKEAGVPVNPTALPVAIALKAAAALVGGDFITAAWETDATTDPDTYIARIRVGGVGSGATIEKADGKYRPYVKITASPEIPVIESDELVEIYS